MRGSYRRTGLAGGLVAVAVLVPTAAWFVSGSAEASRRAAELEDRARSEVVLELAVDAERLGARLESLRERESARPFYHYQNLFHDPKGAAQGLAVIPSPLAHGAADPLIWAHFQIDEQGAVSLPTVSESFPELSTDEGFSHFCDVLGELQNGFIVARLDGQNGAAVAGLVDAEDADRVLVLDRDTWDQIRLADAVYANLTGRPPQAAGTSQGASAVGNGDVEIRVEPLRWHTIVLGAGPSLAALRQVTTPAGLLVQGFVVGDAGVGEWLGTDSVFEPTMRAHDLMAAAPVADTDWSMVADVGPAVAAARAAGRDIVNRFREHLRPELRDRRAGRTRGGGHRRPDRPTRPSARSLRGRRRPRAQDSPHLAPAPRRDAGRRARRSRPVADLCGAHAPRDQSPGPGRVEHAGSVEARAGGAVGPPRRRRPRRGGHPLRRTAETGPRGCRECP